MTIAQWSTNAALNVVSSGTVGTGGVNIDEGCPPSTLNNSMRDIMAQIATWRTAGTVGSFFGQTVIGHTAALTIGGQNTNFQVLGTGAASNGMVLASFSTNAAIGSRLDFYRSKAATIGTAGVVVNGDNLGSINWYGAQQGATFANQNIAAQIIAEVDGVVTSGAGADMPGRIIFSTTPDGSGTPAERMRIASDGTITIAAAAAFIPPVAAAPAPTVEGSMAWDSNEDVFRVGNGTTTVQIGIGIGTATPTTSGTTVDFTSIPAGTKRITVSMAGVSTNGTSPLLLQIGDSGGIENTGYLGATTQMSSAVSSANATAGFQWGSAAAASVHHGALVLTLLDPSTNTWACEGVVALSNTAVSATTAGSKPLSATLDRIRLTATNGTDTFDAGSVNILYE